MRVSSHTFKHFICNLIVLNTLQIENEVVIPAHCMFIFLTLSSRHLALTAIKMAAIFFFMRIVIFFYCICSLVCIDCSYNVDKHDIEIFKRYISLIHRWLLGEPKTWPGIKWPVKYCAGGNHPRKIQPTLLRVATRRCMYHPILRSQRFYLYIPTHNPMAHHLPAI